MVENISIKNFKSIKDLTLKTSRVNIFIGEHNSGKSNILEALSWFSINSLAQDVFPEIFRFKTATDFFYDSDASKPLEIKTDELSFFLRYAKNENGALMNYIEGFIYPTKSEIHANEIYDFHNIHNKLTDHNFYAFRLSFDGQIDHIAGGQLSSPFKTYSFKKLKKFQNNFRPFLNPPYGDNIPSLLVSNKEYRDLVSSIFKEKGFRLMLKPTEVDINMAKDIEDELYVYPYTSISETLQRIIFYLLAIETNKNSSLIFDEPESNTFPMYTKQLAEIISLDDSNQYFIATHDPYLLASLIGKTPIKDLSVFVTEMDSNYDTKVTNVPSDRFSEIMDKGFDVYFNLDKLTHK